MMCVMCSHQQTTSFDAKFNSQKVPQQCVFFFVGCVIHNGIQQQKSKQELEVKQEQELEVEQEQELEVEQEQSLEVEQEQELEVEQEQSLEVSRNRN